MLGHRSPSELALRDLASSRVYLLPPTAQASAPPYDLAVGAPATMTRPYGPGDATVAVEYTTPSGATRVRELSVRPLQAWHKGADVLVGVGAPDAKGRVQMRVARIVPAAEAGTAPGWDEPAVSPGGPPYAPEPTLPWRTVRDDGDLDGVAVRGRGGRLFLLERGRVAIAPPVGLALHGSALVVPSLEDDVDDLTARVIFEAADGGLYHTPTHVHMLEDAPVGATVLVGVSTFYGAGLELMRVQRVSDAEYAQAPATPPLGRASRAGTVGASGRAPAPLPRMTPEAWAREADAWAEHGNSGVHAAVLRSLLVDVSMYFWESNGIAVPVPEGLDLSTPRDDAVIDGLDFARGVATVSFRGKDGRVRSVQSAFARLSEVGFGVPLLLQISGFDDLPGEVWPVERRPSAEYWASPLGSMHMPHPVMSRDAGMTG